MAHDKSSGLPPRTPPVIADEVADAIRALLVALNVDVESEAFVDTPRRAALAWIEWTRGERTPLHDLIKTFREPAAVYDEMVVVHNVPIVGMCPHHLAPITGTAHIGYVPDADVIGLSKLARIAQAACARLATQEEMTAIIAETLVTGLNPKGVGVLIRATHGCMTTRGVHMPQSCTTTSAMRGVFFNNATARQEFLQLCTMAETSGGH